MADDPVLEEMVRRICALAQPDSIILFGSRARGEARPGSDYDLLIIGPSDQKPWQRTGRLYAALAGMGVPKDILWSTPQELKRWKDAPAHVYARALKEGRRIYERGK